MRFTKYTYCTCLTHLFFFHVHMIKDKNPSSASLKSDLLKDLADGPIPHAQTTGMPSDSSSLPLTLNRFFSFRFHSRHFSPPQKKKVKSSYRAETC